MSLSPIFSIMSDFLAVVMDPESECGGPRLRDMCREIGAAFFCLPAEEILLLGDGLLISPTAWFLLFGKDDPFSFFIDDCEEDIFLEAGVVFESLGFEMCGDLAIGDTTFFITDAVFLSLFAKAI